MPDNINYKEILKREGIKNTKHRCSIIEILGKSDAPVTAEDIFIRLHESSKSICLSTVYRTLETLISKGLVSKTIISSDNRAVYELNTAEHKHHLVCVGCKRMVSIDGCPFNEYEKEIQGKNGFDITGHKLEIYGFCPECRTDKET